jgi:TonB family protein
MFSTLPESGHMSRPTVRIATISLAVHSTLVAAVAVLPARVPPLPDAKPSYEPVAFASIAPRTDRSPTTPTPRRRPRRPVRTALTLAGSATPPLLPVLAVLDLAVLDLLDASPAVDLPSPAVTAADFDRAAASQALVASAFKRVPHDERQPYLSHQVELRPEPLEDNPKPEYPLVLMRQHIEGRVAVQFVVDTSGVADLRTLQIITSAHPLFTRAVTTVLAQMRFRAGETGDHKVRVRVVWAFAFIVR